jgi:hypothetical protein
MSTDCERKDRRGPSSAGIFLVYADFATVKLFTAAICEMNSDARVGRAAAFRRVMLALIGKGELYEAHHAYWGPLIVEGGWDAVSADARPGASVAIGISVTAAAGSGLALRTYTGRWKRQLGPFFSLARPEPDGPESRRNSDTVGLLRNLWFRRPPHLPQRSEVQPARLRP